MGLWKCKSNKICKLDFGKTQKKGKEKRKTTNYGDISAVSYLNVAKHGYYW